MLGLMAHWWAWALMAALFAALTAVLAKVGVDELPSDLATLVRTLVVVVLAALVVAASGSGSAWGDVRGRTLTALVASGLATGASWLCYFQALKLGQASQVAPVDKLSIVFVALAATLFLGETLSGTAWLGLGLVAMGAMLVARG